MADHGITRDEWENRFMARIKDKLHSEDDAELNAATLRDVTASELESWPVSEDDWKSVLPEEAADEQLSYWTD